MNRHRAAKFSMIVIAIAVGFSVVASPRGAAPSHHPLASGATYIQPAAHSILPNRQQSASPDEEKPSLAPPPVLFIQREVVAKGKMGDQNEIAAKILTQYQNHHLPFHVLGMTSMVPTRDEVMVIVAYPSFAAIDDIGKQFSAQPPDFLKAIGELRQQEDALAESKTAMLASFRPDLSYRADSKAIAQARLFWVDQFIVPQGHMPDYEADSKFMQAAATKANVDEHYFVYQTVAGAESQTLIVFRPLKSLADWDKSADTAAAMERALDVAGKQRFARIWKGTVLQGPGQSLERLYVFRPDLSITSPEFAAFNMDFWRPKTE